MRARVGRERRVSEEIWELGSGEGRMARHSRLRLSDLAFDPVHGHVYLPVPELGRVHASGVVCMASFAP